ncbi:VOC family protein [Leucobacter luti]|uniref:VOC domain-containing protein n=1 Tax=Leucobacter luti TaxID=340320 RepID=A0A4Q7U220_9MICO|nr:VOC family protein [Leucobacter luti]RZT66867.1 hypothetical protein EV139_0994 [Leucobacter luti]
MTPQPSSGAVARRQPTITDICLVTPDVDRSVDFYTQQLGFTLRSRMPGFADFEGPGVILAVWENAQLERATGIPGHDAAAPARTVMLACELESPEAIDRVYEEYRERGVEFVSEPRDYPWNARCVYFDGPNGEFWEFFAWYEGGEPGIVGSTHEGVENV